MKGHKNELEEHYLCICNVKLPARSMLQSRIISVVLKFAGLYLVSSFHFYSQVKISLYYIMITYSKK